MKKNLRLPPGPRLLSYPRRWLLYTRDQERFYLGMREEFGPIVRLPMDPLLTRMAYVVSEPALVKHYLIDNAANYTKNFFAGRRDIVAGEAVSTSEGTFWRRHRRLVQPAFQRDWMSSQVPRMVDAVLRYLERYWDVYARQGQPVDMLREMSRLNLSLLGPIVFSQDPSEELRDALYTYYIDAIRERTTGEFIASLLLPGHVQYLIKKRRQPTYFPSAELVDRFARGLVAQRRQSPDAHDDMLARVMAARDEKGEGLDDLEVRDELVDIFYGGHVSSTATMAWAWYCLATLPEVNARVVDEVEQVLHGRSPTAADLPRFQYTTRVMEETFRKYPPAPGLIRVALKDDQIAGYDVPAGTVVGASSFVMHNHPDYWARPSAFDPDHFLPEVVERRPKFVYIPFGGGQRLCIGERLAMMMSSIILSLVSQRYRVSLVPGLEVKGVKGGVYHPQNLLMRIERAERPARAVPAA
jgi:cytochrome P450